MNPNDDLQERWHRLEEKIARQFGKTPDLETILMLIGFQEVRNTKNKFDKEQKQDLMHIAVCTLLSQSGYYALDHYDEDGWPHFNKLKELPAYNPADQENFIKDHVLLYFDMEERIFENNI